MHCFCGVLVGKSITDIKIFFLIEIIDFTNLLRGK